MVNAEKLIIENLDIWTTAIREKKSKGRGINIRNEFYGIKKLRELILEMAVLGKLVSQDPNDEHVSKLIQQIQAEKSDLIKSRKIKNTKFPSFLTEDEKSFGLPVGWEWAPLGIIGNIFNGNSISTRIKEEKYTNSEGIPFIATKDVGYGFEILDYDNGISIPIKEPKFKTAHAGSVLICAEGGSAGKKCGVTDREICFGNKLFANELHGNIEPNFILIFYLSSTFYKQFSQSMTGIIGGISVSKFAQIQCPLPPIREQQRIVTKVKKLMEICDLLEKEQINNLATHQILLKNILNSIISPLGVKSQDKKAWERIENNFDNLFTNEKSVDQLKETILQLAVMGKLVSQDSNDESAEELLDKIATKRSFLENEGIIKKQKIISPIEHDDMPFPTPPGWVWTRLGNVARRIHYGYTAKANHEISKVRLLRITDIQDNNVDWDSVPGCEITEKEFIQYKLNTGDILIARTGGTVGKSLLVKNIELDSVFASYLIRVEKFEDIYAPYLKVFLGSALYWDQLIAGAKGAAQPNVNGQTLSAMMLPLPPISEQYRIVAKVDELISTCEKLKLNLNKAQTSQLNLADSIVESTIRVSL